MIAKFEILNALPTTGPMYIPVADNDEEYYSQGYTIKFFRDNGSEWVANFKPGLTDLNCVYSFDGYHGILVIAGGTCYYMNPNDFKPIAIFGGGYEIVLNSSDGRLIILDSVGITVFEPTGNYWHSVRISFDGFKELEYSDKVVTGLSYFPMFDAEKWDRFSYNIDTKVLTGGSWNMTSNNKKYWWKFWK